MSTINSSFERLQAVLASDQFDPRLKIVEAVCPWVKPVPSILETLQRDPEDSDYITPSIEGAFAVITKGLYDSTGCYCEGFEATPENPLEVIGVNQSCFVVRRSNLFSKCSCFEGSEFALEPGITNAGWLDEDAVATWLGLRELTYSQLA